MLCGRSEKSIGVLEKAHIKAHYRGGIQVVPMCPTCHRKYDAGKMSASELKKIGINPKNYGMVRLKNTQKKEKKKDPFSIEVPNLLGDGEKKRGIKRKKKDEFGFDLF